ncbi:sigma-70 family RNA polymerase sigma factor [Planctomycetales bacterium ZRK34]|nr:sigma-70 family RNA polymerase sigma factor [Planctomycetales bacterium ZRK34]
MDEKLLVQTLLRCRLSTIAFLRAILVDAHLADDIYQDVSLMAVEKRQQFNDADHLAAWLRTAARHRALNAVRDRKSRPLALDADVIERLDMHWPKAPGSTSEVGEALAQCLGELSEYARRLITLRYEHDLSGDKLAEAVGRNTSTVAVALSRTRRTLHNCIHTRLEQLST